VNQQTEWTLLLRSPVYRIRVACVASQPETGAKQLATTEL
jgi:hypothetical protein